MAGASLIQQRVYEGFDRPDVLVEVEGVWCRGELMMWTQHDDETWTGHVTYRDAAGMRRRDAFPSERIQLDPTDYSPTQGQGAAS